MLNKPGQAKSRERNPNKIGRQSCRRAGLIGRRTRRLLRSVRANVHWINANVLSGHRMQQTESRVIIHMVASLDGFIARTDGSVDWLETTDTFEDGKHTDPELVRQFL